MQVADKSGNRLQMTPLLFQMWRITVLEKLGETRVCVRVCMCVGIGEEVKSGGGGSGPAWDNKESQWKKNKC